MSAQGSATGTWGSERGELRLAGESACPALRQAANAIFSTGAGGVKTVAALEGIMGRQHEAYAPAECYHVCCMLIT